MQAPGFDLNIGVTVLQLDSIAHLRAANVVAKGRVASGVFASMAARDGVICDQWVKWTVTHVH